MICSIFFQHLVSKGIGPKRMEVRAWGGKKPIYDEDHPNAQANVRAEIEILAIDQSNGLL